jgi:hypothetical protein
MFDGLKKLGLNPEKPFKNCGRSNESGEVGGL